MDACYSVHQNWSGGMRISDTQRLMVIDSGPTLQPWKLRSLNMNLEMNLKFVLIF